MKPASFFRILVTSCLLVLASGEVYAAGPDRKDPKDLKARAAQEASLEECISQSAFEAPFFRTRGVGEGKISQKQCRVKFVVFQGKGEKVELDLCSAEVGVFVYPAIDSETATAVKGGSFACPATALFGADFDQTPADLERFDKEKTRILDLLRDARGAYGKENKMPTTGGKLLCLERLVKEYLQGCKTFDLPLPIEDPAPAASKK